MDKKTCDLAFVISDLGGGGAQRVLVTLANAWAKSGRRISVVTFARSEDDFFILDEAIERHTLGGLGRSPGVFGGVISNWRRISALRKCLRSISPKSALGFVGSTNIVLIIAAMGLRTKVFISERNDPAKQSFGRLWDTLRRLLYRHADVVTANSQAALSTLSAYVPRHKLVFVPNPIYRPYSKELPERSGNTILAVGRLYPQKGYDILLRAFSIFHAEHKEWKLLILGDGPLKVELQNQATREGVDENVFFMGRVKDPFPYYRSADIYALSSLYEGTPNALLEAMGQGAPCVVTDALPGALEYIEHEKTGLVVRASDSQNLAEAFKRLAEDTALRAVLGEQGRKSLSSHSNENVIRTWEQVLGWL